MLPPFICSQKIIVGRYINPPMSEEPIQKILRSRNNDFIKTYSEGNIRYIVYNRPQKANAFTLDMYIKASDAIRSADRDASVKFIVIYGEGNSFSSGNDITNFTDPDFAHFTPSEMAPYMAKTILEEFTRNIISCIKPIMAIVHGHCTGVGFTQLGLFDRIYAAEGSKFRAPLVMLAQGPEMCSSYTFPKMLGTPLANEILIEGKQIGSDELEKHKFAIKVKNVAEGKQLCKKYIEMLSGLDYASLIETRSLMRHFEKRRLLVVNEMECRNLVERWLHPKLPQHLMKYLEDEKIKRTSKL